MAKAIAEIRSLARAHTETALRVLAGIMEQETAPHAARVSAAPALLDRGWGKPHQTAEITHIRKPAAELSDDELAGIISERGRERDSVPSLDPAQLN